MALNVALLRSSFDLLVEREPEIMHRFYEVLFARYPQARSLFGRNSGPQQERMLASALGSVLEHLEDGPWLQKTLGDLGAKHVGYGVTDEMYAWVGDALLITLAEVAGPDWNIDLYQAWAEAYGAIVGLMLAGADAAYPHRRRGRPVVSALRSVDRYPQS